MRRHKGNRLVLILTLILIAFGMIMIYIIGPLRAQQLGEANESAYFIGQIKAVAVSLVLFFLSWKVFSKNMKLLDIAPKILMALALLSCAALWVGGNAGMGFVSCQLGGCRWLKLGPISLQPAEFVKFSLILYLASIFTKYRGKGAKGITIGETVFTTGMTGYACKTSATKLLDLDYFVDCVCSDCTEGYGFGCANRSDCFLGYDCFWHADESYGYDDCCNRGSISSNDCDVSTPYGSRENASRWRG